MTHARDASNRIAANRAALLRGQDLEETPANPLNDDRDAITEEDQTILVVDDDKYFSKILQGKIRAKGYRCLNALDGLVGLQLIDRYSPDAVILDIDLPGIDGVSVYERARQNPDTRNLPIYFITAHDNKPVLSDDNAIGFLSKPASAEQLENVFLEIEAAALSTIRHVMIVEDDEALRRAVFSSHEKTQDSDIRSGQWAGSA